MYTEAYKKKKRDQYNAYGTLLGMLAVSIVILGVLGIVQYFLTGNILATIVAAIGIVLCIGFMLSKNIKSRIIYEI